MQIFSLWLIEMGLCTPRILLMQIWTGYVLLLLLLKVFALIYWSKDRPITVSHLLKRSWLSEHLLSHLDEVVFLLQFRERIKPFRWKALSPLDPIFWLWHSLSYLSKIPRHSNRIQKLFAFLRNVNFETFKGPSDMVQQARHFQNFIAMGSGHWGDLEAASDHRGQISRIVVRDRLVDPFQHSLIQSIHVVCPERRVKGTHLVEHAAY